MQYLSTECLFSISVEVRRHSELAVHLHPDGVPQHVRHRDVRPGRVPRVGREQAGQGGHLNKGAPPSSCTQALLR